ncbi:hypothetical protein [Shewanella sp.]|mgnify:CR=1 FL=1|uniref:hypothetical protein n=1 Tax=Shewanella sp. TaxID=50422 RepID=UPI001B77BAC2|nr:hypothetical protein [Shewanella sp.]MBP6520999.1 hypothetical protein [Shewanella sp.]
MITKTGQQILNELKSEQSMDLEDKKWWFLFKEVGSIPHFLWHIFRVFLKVIFTCFILTFILTLVTLDEQSISWFLSHSATEIIGFKNQFISLTLGVAGAYLVFYSYRYWRYYIGMKQQYKSDHAVFFYEQKLQIELIEEVLHRHKLIDRKE